MPTLYPHLAEYRKNSLSFSTFLLPLLLEKQSTKALLFKHLTRGERKTITLNRLIPCIWLLTIKHVQRWHMFFGIF